MALPDASDRARMRRIINRLISYGVEVREMPGHETRGFLFPGADPSRVVDHHDASSLKAGEWGALGLCLDGTPRGIPGPLCNVLVARCLDGRPRVAIVADGYAYHAGTGGPYAELPKNDANPRTYGVEKANDGLGEPYTAAANYATNALFHAMAIESGHIPESFPIGHKEWAPGRKSDPLYSMADRRRQVAAFTPVSEDDMQLSDPIESRIPVDIDPATGKGKTVPLSSLLQNIQLNAYGALVTAHAALEAAQRVPTSAASTGGIDYGHLATALADELDRRSRDGNPATGPAS